MRWSSLAGIAIWKQTGKEKEAFWCSHRFHERNAWQKGEIEFIPLLWNTPWEKPGDGNPCGVRFVDRTGMRLDKIMNIFTSWGILSNKVACVTWSWDGVLHLACNNWALLFGPYRSCLARRAWCVRRLLRWSKGDGGTISKSGWRNLPPPMIPTT